MERFELTPGYSISRIIKGGWHLAGGHGKIDAVQAVRDMRAFVDAGITTFDCADIYTGVEELIGKFLRTYKAEFKSGALDQIQIHTKYVPDYNALKTVTFEDTNRIISRSLKRLGIERLDLVQFAWWDYKVPRYIEVIHHLKSLQETGKIRHIGITNFDGQRMNEIIKSGIDVISNQVQYSVIDRRVEKDMDTFMDKYNVKYLCYGVLAGGFLSDRYLRMPDPVQPLENRSLTKYRLIIDEFGGYKLFQFALTKFREIADKYDVDIAEVVTRYILQKKKVAGAIIGARNIDHLNKYRRIFNFSLDNSDLAIIKDVLKLAKGPEGPFYELERDKTGKHGSIMKYNLNAK